MVSFCTSASSPGSVIVTNRRPSGRTLIKGRVRGLGSCGSSAMTLGSRTTTVEKSAISISSVVEKAYGHGCFTDGAQPGILETRSRKPVLTELTKEAKPCAGLAMTVAYLNLKF